ncbi:MAG: hypothetical protein E7166_06530 [Firmicutes bacterium]|nr:hypothetical protein [Bacillota bacterium]
MSSNEIPFGYKFDGQKGEIVAEEKEMKLVNTIFDLFTEYNINQMEITDLLNGFTTIKDIIIFRIEKICETAQFYNKDLLKEFDNVDIDNILTNKEEIDKKIITPLLNNKDGIKNLDTTMNDIILKQIDDVILLINKQEEIENKYGDFTQLKKNNTTDLER